MARTPIALPDHLGRVLEEWIEIVLGSVFLVGYLVGIVLSGRSLKLRLLVGTRRPAPFVALLAP